MAKSTAAMRVVLLIPFYIDKHKARRRELEYCLKQNLGNKEIGQVVAVCDSDTELPYNKKLTVINIGRRQKYVDMFRLAGSINPDGINMVANADIFFTKESILQIKEVDYAGLVLALSRWDLSDNKRLQTTTNDYKRLRSAKLHDHHDSQDVWIWQGKMDDGIYCDFELGKAGCDNRIAYELGQKYNIMNPSKSIKSYHLHLSGIRNYKPKDAVPPPYLRVRPCYYSPKKKTGGRAIGKVLHVGLNHKGQTALGRVLREIGGGKKNKNNYRFFNWQKEIEKHGLLEMRKRLVSLSREFKPDLTFMQIQTAGIVNPITASAMGGYLFNWTGDVRSDINWLRDLAPYVDATCLTNETDTEQLRSEGINSWFLQIGFENGIFKPEGDRMAESVFGNPDIVFMGNNYKDKFPLSKERYEIAHKLRSTYRNKFLLCGQGWDWELGAINLMGRTKEEAMVYRSCKIAINANHFLHKRFSSDRVHRIMGSGAFCLTRRYPGIEKDFTEGEHLRTFNNLDEMIFLIDYYLKNDDEREYIAEQGCKLIHEKFVWNKKLIQQIASFPWEKKKIKEIVPGKQKPMTNEEWMEYLRS